MKKPLVILTGPTAAGKTKLSINLAKAINGEIVSADSIQVYRRMDIGSAKIRPAEMQGVPHHLIDVLDPKEDFNVVLFLPTASARRVPNTSAQSAGIFPEALHLYHQWQDLSSRARWYRT